MSASHAGRESAYQNWSQKELARALIQAEDEIKGLEALLREATEERAQYYQESRHSAQVLGGILRVLRDNGVGGILDLEVPDDAPNLQRLGARHRRFVYGDGIRTELDAEREERSSWFPPDTVPAQRPEYPGSLRYVPDGTVEAW